MARTRIRKLYLHGYRQFKDVVLDFTHPATGDTLDRVCLIGSNGTGKSTALRILGDVLHGNLIKFEGSNAYQGCRVEIEHEGRRFLVPGRTSPIDPGVVLYAELTGLAEEPCLRLARAATEEAFIAVMNEIGATAVLRTALRDLGIPLQPGDLTIYCPAEVQTNAALKLDGPPSITLDSALGLFRGGFPVHQEVSNQSIAHMWGTLVYLIKRRESDRQEFENRPESLPKTKAQLIAEFDRLHPSPLHALAAVWDRILAPANLELDVEGARVPVQLTENLEALLRFRDSKVRLSYGDLSTGIRNFLFRIGHIFLLYFNRPVDRAFLLVDEPENSLFPDFLFELMDIYEDLLRHPDGSTHTQAFFATHSPLVAAQFEPHERIILEWDDRGGVAASRGTSPKGDDPNDVLRQDFRLAEVMGPAGRASWERYLELRRRLRSAAEEDKPKLMEEASDLARRYGFGASRP